MIAFTGGAFVASGVATTGRGGGSAWPERGRGGRISVSLPDGRAARSRRRWAQARPWRRGPGADAGAAVQGARGAARQRRPAADQAAQDANQDVIIAGLVGGGSGGLTPLVFAAREGDIETAKVLLDAGADVNQATEYGWTPLLVATNNRNYKLGALLLERGAESEHRQQGRLDAAVSGDGQPQHRRRRLSGAEAGHGPPRVHQAPAGEGRRPESCRSRKTR